jgi:hypothetical protein
MCKKIDEAKTCSVCGTALSGVDESCPACMLRKGLADSALYSQRAKGRSYQRDGGVFEQDRDWLMKDVTGDCQGGVGYHHVQVIRKDFTLPSFFNGQCGPIGKEFRQMAHMTRIKMLYEHVCHTRTGRNARKKRGN